MNLQHMTLHAGPLSLEVCQGELRYVRWGAREILRRVYVAVRDAHWNTIPLEIVALKYQPAEDEFLLAFHAVHQQGEIDFQWHGTITGNAAGTITFTMDGTAQRAFQRNRIGLCILHPPDCARQSCRIEHADGSVTEGAFPRFIAPHQPFLNIRAITHEVAPGVRAEVRMTGDVFEMEDQRNWTDGSFKTYSTPLTLPFPVTVQRGDRVRQSFTLTLQGEWSEPVEITTSPVTISWAEAAPTPLPQIGLGRASHGQLPSPIELHRLRLLKLAHLRADVWLSAADWRDTFAAAVHEARALQTELEVALFLSDDGAQELLAVQQAAAQLDAPVVRWLIFHQAEKVTAEKWIALARATLGATAPIGAGTNQYFTELNRNRPVDTTADVLCYSLNPQVHASDEDTLRESLAAQAATVESARQFLGDTPLVISPVTLKPRFNPHAPQQATTPDLRQPSLFAAAWTLGSVKYLAESGVASLTYFETTGARGVLANEVFPLWQVFADVGEFAGGEVLPTISSAPLKVIGLTLRRDDRQRVMLANVSVAAQAIRLTLNAHRVAMRRLNESNIAAEDFRHRSPEMVVLTNDQLELRLSPYEIITLDCL